MKVEQACRFRMDELGYVVTARSEGFGYEQEKALGDAFNEGMNGIFPKPGDSVLSCAVNEACALLARNTLRTDGRGRFTLFTHSYAFPIQEYKRLMRESPETLLGVSMFQFRDMHAGGDTLETLKPLELPFFGNDELVLEDLFCKYNLTPDRYARLLMGACEALTSNASLRLYTTAPVDRTEQMIRELTYCIVAGLLPSLRERVSFSSGADTRMKISMIHQGCAKPRGEDLVFGVEDDSVTNLMSRGELGAEVFSFLGRATPAERSDILEKMDAWLREVCDVEEGLSMTLISLAYFFCGVRDVTQEFELQLFRSIMDSARNPLSIRQTNTLLTGLLRDMLVAGRVSNNALSIIGEWYLKDSSEDYRKLADTALAEADKGICAALINVVTRLELTDRIRGMLSVLLQGMPADHRDVTAEAKEFLVSWILEEDVCRLLPYCEAVLLSYPEPLLNSVISNILRSAEDRLLRQTEKSVLARLLARLAQCGASGVERLPEEVCDLLDGRADEYHPELIEAATDYFFEVRLAVTEDMEKKVDLIRHVCNRASLMGKPIVKRMCNEPRYAVLLEHYVARGAFSGELTLDKIRYQCKTYNTYLNPSGVFENKAFEAWAKLVTVDLEQTVFEEKDGRKLAEKAVRRMSDVDKLTVSPETRERMKNYLCSCFWRVITYGHLISGGLSVPDAIRARTRESEFKLTLMDVLQRFGRDPRNAEELVDIVVNSGFGAAEQEKLLSAVLELAYKVIRKQKFVSWDVLLLQCRQEDGSYSPEKLDETVWKLEQRMKKDGITCTDSSAAYSVILKDEELRKFLSKKLDSSLYEVPVLVRTLLDELKSARRGGLGFVAKRQGRPEGRSVSTLGYGSSDGKREKGKDGPTTSREKSAAPSGLSGFRAPFSDGKDKQEEKTRGTSLFGKGKSRR